METAAGGRKKNSTKWALVLMGGGARGLAHIGVLQVLEREGLIPDIIAGTSMGGIVGGLFAAGLSGDQLATMVGDLRLSDGIGRAARPALFRRPRNLFEYLMLADYKNRLFKKMGLDRGDAIEAYLKSCVGDVRIESLPVKFICNAVDLASGKEIMFTEGKLYKALRATMSLPLLFAPSWMNGRLLLDGGVLDNAPVEAARQAGAEVAGLVAIHRPLKKMAPEKIKNTLQVLQRVIEVARADANDKKTREADFVLRIALDIEILDFSNPRAIVRKGERTAAAKLPMIRKAITPRAGS